MNKYEKKKNKKIIISLICTIVLFCSTYLSDKYGVISFDSIMTSLGLRDKAVVTAEGEISVHYIDVGQGDCQLIISDGKSVLIDGGEAENADKVINYLKSNNIDYIDYMIATHPHSDHIGSFAKIINTFDIGKFYMPKVSDELTPTSMVYENLLKALMDNNLKVSTAEFGEVIDLGVSTLTMYPPQKEYENVNNYSIVCRLDHGENSFLFTGDAERESEKDLIELGADLESDVLKVAHHGSSSSSITSFLNEVNPTLCVISCGTDNRYNHPNDKTVDRLSKFTENILRTDLLGTIVVISGENKIKYSYENE